MRKIAQTYNPSELASLTDEQLHTQLQHDVTVTWSLTKIQTIAYALASTRHVAR